MMRTDDLIAMLARNAPPVEPGILRRRYAMALGCGFAGAAALMLAILGVRPDLAAAVRLPMFWVKLALPLALVIIAFTGTTRLARPGVALGRVAAAVPVPVAAIWVLSGIVLVAADPGRRVAMLLGDSWSACPFNIAMLSVPVFAGVFWAMRGLAPTRLALAGAFSGLLAGAAGALVYCLHCPEMEAPFIGTWYLLGIAIPALAGALAGPRLLRW
jgi:hypothetical protein